MGFIQFEPQIGYYAIIRAKIHNFIPSSYNNFVYDDGRSDHYGVGLVRKGEECYIYLDKLRDLPDSKIRELMHQTDSKYGELGSYSVVNYENKVVMRKLTANTSNFLKEVSHINGTVIYPFALMGDEDTLFAFKIPESSMVKFTEVFLDYQLNAPFDVSIHRIDKEKNVPTLLHFFNSVKMDYSLLVFVETVWKMTDSELREENHGVFQNRMKYQVRYSIEESPPIVGEIFENSGERIKGDADTKILDRQEDRLVVEFNFKYRWFSEFYKHVMMTTRGNFSHWGYSDGISELHNYYVVPRSNLLSFMNGLKQYWNLPTRVKHRNIITRVEGFESIIKRIESGI